MQEYPRSPVYSEDDLAAPLGLRLGPVGQDRDDEEEEFDLPPEETPEEMRERMRKMEEDQVIDHWAIV